MATTSWALQGQYMESCSCLFFCPCITRNAQLPATEDSCKVAMAFSVERGHHGDVRLDGLAFAVVAQSPRVMADGNWVMGLVIDAQAGDEQAGALAAIVSGAAGGPMAAFAPLIGEFRGVERHPIDFVRSASGCSVRIGTLVDHAVEGIPSAAQPGDFIAIDNTFHPANPRLNLAVATRSHFHAFGIDWDDDSATRNGHFAPFHWAGP